MQLHHRDLSNRLVRLFKEAREDVLIASPFVGREGIRLATDNIGSRFRKTGRITLLTDLSPRNIYQCSTDPFAIRDFCRALDRSTLRYLPSLHAKVYLADDGVAIITSSNFTAGGLYRNYEYGVEINDRTIVSQVRADIQEYASLGTAVAPDNLDALCSAALDLRELYKRQLKSISRTVAQQFNSRLRGAEDDLIRMRLEGGAMHTIFERTLLYLLKRCGPLSTKQLHPLIAAIHPDLCDDTIDRVINGEHFGKKWKHAVRTAQQQLKRKDLIVFDGLLWKVRQYYGA